MLLPLLRIALTGKPEPIPADTDWKAVDDYVYALGLHGTAFDALDHLKKAMAEPQSQVKSFPDIYTFLDWLGPVNQMEIEFDQRMKVADDLASLCSSHGIEVVLLKGYSIAQFFPNPKHRYSCDLDVFIEDGWDKACELLEERGINLVREVYKEVEFTTDSVYVECHRYITPFRGHKHLRACELYLRSELHKNKTQPEGHLFYLPPLSFITMLFTQHALGDLLHGNLKFRHVVDWVVLRKQQFDRATFDERCKEFGFDRFVKLIDALADCVEGKTDADHLPADYKEIFDHITTAEEREPRKLTWFQRRVSTFKLIVKNRKYYNRFGFCSMSTFLFNSLWTHFVKKEVKV